MGQALTMDNLRTVNEPSRLPVPPKSHLGTSAVTSGSTAPGATGRRLAEKSARRSSSSGGGAPVPATNSCASSARELGRRSGSCAALKGK